MCSLFGECPEQALLRDIAAASYDKHPPRRIHGVRSLKSTSTLKFYVGRGKTIFVGVRGTHDSRDLRADAMLVQGRLNHSRRFRDDVQVLEEFQEQYPCHEYTYFDVGHSLGGAILDSFLDRGLLHRGHSFNPAVQRHHLGCPAPNHARHYARSDPLYRLGRRYLVQPPVLHDASPDISGHSLDQFRTRSWGFTLFHEHLTLSLSNIRQGRLLAMIGSTFVHHSAVHLVLNMAALMVLAPVALRYTSPRAFLGLYVTSGVVASSAQLVLDHCLGDEPAVGATGSVCGVAGYALACVTTVDGALRAGLSLLSIASAVAGVTNVSGVIAGLAAGVGPFALLPRMGLFEKGCLSRL